CRRGLETQAEPLERSYKEHVGRRIQTSKVDRAARRAVNRSLPLLVNVEALRRRACLGICRRNCFLSRLLASQEIDEQARALRYNVFGFGNCLGPGSLHIDFGSGYKRVRRSG